jgi:hypothetical protein
MSNRLQKIKEYCNHYDYLDYINLDDLKWLIEQAEESEKSFQKGFETGRKDQWREIVDPLYNRN